MAEPVKEGQGGGAAGEQKPADGTGTAAKPNWYDTYPKEFHEDLKGYDKPETLAKEHVELRKKYRVPADPKEYEFDVKELDDVQKTNLETFKAEAKEIGLTKEQFKKLTEKGLQQNKEMRERIKKEQAAAKKAESDKVQKGVDELKAEWGNKFDEKLSLAKKTMESIFPASFGKFLDESDLGNHPEMVKAMVRLAESVSEDVLVKNQRKAPASNRDPQTGAPMLKFPTMK